MGAIMKVLYMVRHAKSTWDEAYTTDFDRPLNKRGRHDAPMMGAVLRERGCAPGIIRSSPAVRAITTARYLAEALGFPLADIETLDHMYGASDRGLLAVVHALPDEVSEAMIVGHNPGMHMLAETLVPLDIANLPTCGIVAAEFGVQRWAEIAPMQGALRFYEHPRAHAEKD